jgi:nanoRNase/pAp phosphatase (c-di-AMP/oligoRNAs hydrolase)
MSPIIIVTPGPEFSDIDGLACAIAYAELLRMEGKDAHALCIGTLNASVPPFLQSVAQTFEKKLIPFDEAVFVDISDNVIIDRFV